MLVLGLNPVLAALNCAMKCGKAEPAATFTQPIQSAENSSMSEHCQRLQNDAAEAGAKPAADSDDRNLIQAQSSISDCDCPSSCGTAVAALINLPIRPAQQLNPPRAAPLIPQSLSAALTGNLYKPPIA